MSSGPIEITDAAGVVRLKGSSKPAIGGPAQQAIYQNFNPGGATLIANGAAAALTIGAKVSGPALLDLTDPTVPLIVEAGTYFVSVDVYSTAPLTAGGFIYVSLNAGAQGANVEALHPESALGGVSVVALAPLGVGDALSVICNNFDGVAARSFQPALLYVVKLG